MVPRPPMRTAGTAPRSAAVRPDSNSPSWFDVPVNSECTALTRPRIASGVRICTSETRMTTLTTSEAPRTASASSERARWVDTPKTTVARPKTETALALAPGVRRADERGQHARDQEQRARDGIHDLRAQH